MLKHNNLTAALPKRVVVIGGSGFLGRDLIKHLSQKNIEAVCVGSKEANLLSADSVQQLKGLVRGDDAVVFTSALTPDKGKDSKTLMKNLAMAENLAAFIEQTPFAHFVHISSDAVYEPSAYLVNEKTLCHPADFYSYMHIGREMIVKTALAKAKIPCAILRPSAVYGSRDTHNSYGPNRFCRTAITDKKITLFCGGEEKRDHVSVHDVSCIIENCLAHRSEGTLNIATGTAHSFVDIANMVAKLSSEKVEVITTPRGNPITHRHFDTTATIQAFPTFQFKSIQEGLAQEFQELKSL